MASIINKILGRGEGTEETHSEHPNVTDSHGTHGSTGTHGLSQSHKEGAAAGLSNPSGEVDKPNMTSNFGGAQTGGYGGNTESARSVTGGPADTAFNHSHSDAGDSGRGGSNEGLSQKSNQAISNMDGGAGDRSGSGYSAGNQSLMSSSGGQSGQSGHGTASSMGVGSQETSSYGMSGAGQSGHGTASSMGVGSQDTSSAGSYTGAGAPVGVTSGQAPSHHHHHHREGGQEGMGEYSTGQGGYSTGQGGQTNYDSTSTQGYGQGRSQGQTTIMGGGGGFDGHGEGYNDSSMGAGVAALVGGASHLKGDQLASQRGEKGVSQGGHMDAANNR